MKKNVYLFQPQYSGINQNKLTLWIPYSVGCLWAYASQFSDIEQNYQIADLVFRREPIDHLVNRMDNPAVCGFSCYVWNEKWCLAAAKSIKERYPNCLIVFGGPQSHSGMTQHTFIDTIMLGEGEINFVSLLRRHLKNLPPELFYTKNRLESLDHIPSPYTAGVFDNIINNNPEVLWNATIETNRGCPYDCTFCDWGSATYSKVKKFCLTKIKEEFDWISKNPIGYVFLADANFGIFKDRDLEIANIMLERLPKSQVDGINIQYAKNSTEVVYHIAKKIESIKRSKGITVSMQSMNNDTLKAIKRKNLQSNNIEKLLSMSEKTNVATYSELILGLPLETITSWKKGITDLLELGQHNAIEIWFAQTLINSELASDTSRNKYGIKTILSKDYYPMYDPDDWRGVNEEIELINSTNTMSTEEMIEAYLWSWMIIHFHITGYTQIYAKYARYRYNIPYINFYDEIWHNIKNSTVLYDNYKSLKKTVTEYLTKGTLPENNKGHALHSMSFEIFYKNKSIVYTLGLEVLEHLTELCPVDIQFIQENFVFDNNQMYPLEIECGYNILDKYQPGHFLYKVDSKLENYTNSNLFTRTGIIKNKITFLSGVYHDLSYATRSNKNSI